MLKTSLEDLIKQVIIPNQLVDHERLFEPSMSKMQNKVVHSLIREKYGVENEQKNT